MDILDVVCLLVLNWLAVTRIGSQDLYFCDTNGLDPCEVVNSRDPFEPEARFVSCNYGTYSQYKYCDRYITPGWYRYLSNMLDRCPNLMDCGALYPYWLNGTHPILVNTEVIRTACKVGFSSCCTRQVTIKIRHCGQYMAYCLPALDSCSARYCFGESGDCNATSENVLSTLFIQSTTLSQTTKSATKTSNILSTTPSLNEQCLQDPCDPRSIENIPNLVNRSEDCVYDSTLRPCDQDIKSVWYEGFHLLNKCPDFLRCGAVYPVWMNGTEPEVKDGIVTRQACKVAQNDCCAEKFEIKVVNCSLFTAYCLIPLRRCEERYCFDTRTCSTKRKNQETSAEGDHSSTTYIILAVVATIIVISIAFVLILYLYIKRCRNQSNDTYEAPIKAQPGNDYEMPVTSHVNHGNVYDELPSVQEDMDYQKLPEEEHYETMKE